MKIARERRFFQVILFALLPLFLLVGVTSCQKEAVDDMSTKILGTWHQTSQVKDGNPVLKDSTRLLMQINSTQICILCDSSARAVKAKTIINRSGWSYTGGLFNLAIDLPASWKPVVDANKLSIERNDFNQSGGISKTTLTFERVANFDIK
ncbi:MAG: hypothetical protein PHT07_15720 [Paludibacter sp.]|nr:hypothetical protein [Paludibacter sp.]